MFRNVTFIIWIGFYLRLCVAAWNGFIGPSMGAGGDASFFHLVAVEHSYNLDIGSMDSNAYTYPLKICWIYPYILGVFYACTAPSLFIGCFLSVAVWVTSAFVLVRIMRLLSFVKSNQAIVMLIYALLPSSIVYTGVTLREPYQLLFINLAVYSVLRIYFNKSLVYWPVLFCTLICMGMLHGALFVFGTFLLIVALFRFSFHYHRSGKHFSVMKLMVVLTLVAYLTSHAIYYFNIYSYGNYALGENLTFIKKIEGFQAGMVHLEARSNYKSDPTINSGIDLLYFVPVNFFQYLFEPMPWRISNTFDLIVMFENILRAWLLWRVWKGFRSVSVQGKWPVLFVLISYLFLEVIWSLGTVSWGNSVRHHVPSVGLLLVVAFAYMWTSHSKKLECTK